MSKNMILLCVIFLASCRNIPPRPVYEYKHFFKSCSVYCFDYNKLKIVNDKRCGEDFKSSTDLNPSECDSIIGPKVTDYATDIKPKAKENIQYCKDLDGY